MEWWAHLRPPGAWSGHPFHYDCDERGLVTTPYVRARHPAVSAVVLPTQPPTDYSRARLKAGGKVNLAPLSSRAVYKNVEVYCKTHLMTRALRLYLLSFAPASS